MQTFIRIILAIVLLFFVYGETGWATTLTLALVIAGSEIEAFMLSRIANG